MNHYHKYLKYKHKYIFLKNKLNLSNNQFAGKKLSDHNSEIKLNNGLDMIKNNIPDANNMFTLSMFDNLDGSSNLFSPIGISFALSLVHLGAIGNTNNELTKLLGYKYTLDDLEYIHELFNNEIMTINNVMIINQNNKINKEYLNMIHNLALILEEKNDDTALISQKANNYIKEKTNSMIKNVISPNDINKYTSLILINTIYFRASWEHNFLVENTTKMEFHQTESNLVDMMHQINYFKYYENKSLQLVELPYNEKNYVMGIILPRKYLEEENMDYSMGNVPDLTPNELNEFINNTELKKIDLYIPKFTHRKNINLVPIFKKMGVIDLFDMKKAQLDIISKEIFISKIVHEAAVIVDEIGTKAAAVTASIVKQHEINPILFKANHAFIYYIRYVPSNIFLFYGDYQGK